jgi:hypothetical protein
MRSILLILLILTCLLWYWGLKRSSQLFVVKIREGRVSFARGRIPPELLADIADIVARAGVIRGVIRGVVSDGAPRLLFQGEMSPGVQQQLRNVVATFSVSQIRHGKAR